jgi:glycerophosphoryl diester phosphodiesterase
MIFLAHRGVWASKPEQNTLAAYRAAFEAGFGVELDVRDFKGRLVISHDVPTEPAVTFDDVLKLHRDYPTRPWIAVNIKADGLAEMAAVALKAARLETYFVFDMSVPDALHYLKAGLRVFTRHSEYETEPSFYREADGIWLDAFHDPWVDPARLLADLRRGKRVGLVSPELHRKPHDEAWALWRAALAASHLPPALIRERLMLCTDFPAEAQAYFSAGDR